MSVIDRSALDADIGRHPVEQPHWMWRMLLWLVEALRPYMGWLPLAACCGLALLPAMALGENRLAELRRIQVGLDLVGPLAVLATWLWLGWRRPWPRGRGALWRGLSLGLGVLFTGLVVLSQVLVSWLPGIGELWRALVTNNWRGLAQQVVGDWELLNTRFVLWWQGVAAGGAAQDNLVFAAVAGAVFWLAGALCAWLARRYEQGLLAAAPPLWLLGMLLLYSRSGRGLMLAGVLLAVALHLSLDQRALVARWQALGLDFSPGLIWDRVVAVVAAVGVLLLVAAVLPNWYFDGLVRRYYDLIQPIDRQLEEMRDRIFPELRGTSRLRSAGGLDGLPNEFLLSGGANLGESIVMLVRTSDSAGYSDYMGMPFEVLTPPAHYMRGVTLTEYDGRGWRNPPATQRTNYDANQRWEEDEKPGRKLLVQNITMMTHASILYGAPEQVEVGLGYEAEFRAAGDLVALWSRADNYTIVSSIPAVSEDQLADAPSWGADLPLPEAYAMHLQLPETVTDRTRQLMMQLTENQETLYGKALAIETYLRQYEYDLDISEPPAAVDDVADYFLFDLRRGYCDYYTTAFIVLARLAGLPARFATGYAAGTWDPSGQVWVITEAAAHSWPEVYFPEYGWIAFEPTASRPTLSRIGLPDLTSAPVVPAAPAPAPQEEDVQIWNWQMLFWLLPIALLLWGGFSLFERWRAQREDPWLGLLRWGKRAGRPLVHGETVIEYGQGLAAHVAGRHTHQMDAGRIVAREITSLSHAVNTVRYGVVTERPQAAGVALEHWRRLRGYLANMRLHR